MPYEESLRLLKNTTNVVELTVSQIFTEYQRKLQQKSVDIREISESNVTGKMQQRQINKNDAEYQWKKAQCLENSRLTYRNEQHINDKINDNDTSCFEHDDCDNNNHDKDVTVLITNQLSKNPCNAPKLLNSQSHFTDTQTFQKHGFNEIPHSSEALNCSQTKMSDNCLISANNCIPDLPKVNLQLS